MELHVLSRPLKLLEEMVDELVLPSALVSDEQDPSLPSLNIASNIFQVISVMRNLVEQRIGDEFREI